MTSLPDNYNTTDRNHFSLGSAEEVGTAIDLIFDAFENACSHEEAVRRAKEYAAEVYCGKERARALEVIEELGRMMELQYWKRKGRRAGYSLS